MKINERIKKCVAFLQIKMADGSFRYVGTCFFVAFEYEKQTYTSAVTAKHVIDEVKKLGLDEICIRFNLRNGITDVAVIKTSAWGFHDDANVDLAILGLSFTDNYDHLYYPDVSFMTNDLIKANEIDCGDEVFITGLFKHHPGAAKSTPIVRIGNIALMPHEKINLKNGAMDAYLIESRSIGGLSGSPVFVNLGDVRKLGGEIKHAQGEHIPLLFGIIHGHFDSLNDDVDAINDSTNEDRKINVGIAIVTPVEKLAQMLSNAKKTIADQKSVSQTARPLPQSPI